MAGLKITKLDGGNIGLGQINGDSLYTVAFVGAAPDPSWAWARPAHTTNLDGSWSHRSQTCPSSDEVLSLRLRVIQKRLNNEFGVFDIPEM